MKIRCLLFATIWLASGATARAQTAADSAAIIAASKDYIDGIWERDSVRLRRAVHPDLVKRQARAGRDGAGDRLSLMTAEQLVSDFGRASDRPRPANWKSDVTILHAFGNMATVAIDAGQWVDYLHLAKWNGQYKIFNVMFDFRRGP